MFFHKCIHRSHFLLMPFAELFCWTVFSFVVFAEFMYATWMLVFCVCCLCYSDALLLCGLSFKFLLDFSDIPTFSIFQCSSDLHLMLIRRAVELSRELIKLYNYVYHFLIFRVTWHLFIPKEYMKITIFSVLVTPLKIQMWEGKTWNNQLHHRKGIRSSD